MGIFDFFKGNKKEDKFFEQKLNSLTSQFESALNSKNKEDYPPPFWYDIIKQRSVYMKHSANVQTISEIETDWIDMHFQEYKTKYTSYSKKDLKKEISLRIERFGFIFKTMEDFDAKLNSLAKENNVNSHPYLNQFMWEKSSASASLMGTIKYALSVGMTNNQVKKLYGDFVYDTSDPLAKPVTNKLVKKKTSANEIKNTNKKNKLIDLEEGTIIKDKKNNSLNSSKSDLAILKVEKGIKEKSIEDLTNTINDIDLLNDLYEESLVFGSLDYFKLDNKIIKKFKETLKSQKLEELFLVNVRSLADMLKISGSTDVGNMFYDFMWGDVSKSKEDEELKSEIKQSYYDHLLLMEQLNILKSKFTEKKHIERLKWDIEAAKARFFATATAANEIGITSKDLEVGGRIFETLTKNDKY